MLEVCLLGTGGTVPLPEKWLTACLLRCRGEEILIDCDEDTLLLKVEQDGAACHTGKYSCFYRNIEGEEVL